MGQSCTSYYPPYATTLVNKFKYAIPEDVKRQCLQLKDGSTRYEVFEHIHENPHTIISKLLKNMTISARTKIVMNHEECHNASLMDIMDTLKSIDTVLVDQLKSANVTRPQDIAQLFPRVRLEEIYSDFIRAFLKWNDNIKTLSARYFSIEHTQKSIFRILKTTKTRLSCLKLYMYGTKIINPLHIIDYINSEHGSSISTLHVNHYSAQLATTTTISDQHFQSTISSVLDSLHNHESLTSLYIGDTIIDTTRSEKLINLLRTNTNITSLDLLSSRIKDGGSLFRAIGNEPTGLKSFQFSMNDTNLPTGRNVYHMLLNNTSIISLGLCAPNPEVINVICEGITLNQNIQNLYLGDVDMRKDETAEHLVSLFGKYKTLKTLSLRFCAIENTTMKYLSNGLANNQTLKKLILHGCKLTFSTMKYLYDGLIQNDTLEMLDLTGSCFSSCNTSDIIVTSIHHVIKYVKLDRPLKRLALANISMDVQSVTKLINSLKKNTTITYLDLSYNSFNDKAYCNTILNQAEHLNIHEIKLSCHPKYEHMINKKLMRNGTFPSRMIAYVNITKRETQRLI